MRSPYQLVCFDLDGVIFQGDNFWLRLHEQLGTLEEGKRLTQTLLYTDYDKLVEEVVKKLWKGKHAKPYVDLVNKAAYLPGVKETFNHLRRHNTHTAIISASSLDLARRAQRDLGVDDVYANELVIKNGIISGDFIATVKHGKEVKAAILKTLCKKLGIRKEACAYVGDSKGDIEAFRNAGLSIAFNTRDEEVVSAADVHIPTNNLADTLPFLFPKKS